MSTWLQILSPEPSIEDAVHAILSARTLGLPIFRRLEANENLPAERIEVTCMRGGETGHRGRYAAGSFSPDAWMAELRITIRMLRSSLARSAHWTAIAGVRLAMTPAAALFSSSNLPHHAIAEMLPQLPEPSLDSAGNEDGTTLVWSMKVSVRKGAMPAAAPA